MTQEQKELLLKDLCGRLPYGVKGNYQNSNDELLRKVTIMYRYLEPNGMVMTGDIKPYLFPLSSMTEEQKEELFFNYIHNDVYFDDFTDYFLAGELWHDICVSMTALPELINWLDKNHFDYRGLIPKGLAIDATGLDIY